MRNLLSGVRKMGLLEDSTTKVGNFVPSTV